MRRTTVATTFDASELVEVEPEPVGRTALRFVIVASVLLVVLVGLVAGGAAAMSWLLPSVDSSGGYCNPITDHCTNKLNLVGIENQTGYTFPAGSVVLESSTSGGNFRYPQERTLVATVQMPAGSAIPVSKDSLSWVNDESTDAEGHVIVQVATSNGKGPRNR